MSLPKPLIHQLKRLNHTLDALQKEWEQRNRKLSQFRSALAIEANTANKFQLEQQVQDEETQLNELNQKIQQAEAEINQVTKELAIVQARELSPTPKSPTPVPAAPNTVSLSSYDAKESKQKRPDKNPPPIHKVGLSLLPGGAILVFVIIGVLMNLDYFRLENLLKEKKLKGGVDDYTSPLSLPFDKSSTEVNANYSKLENLLKEKKWREANHETEALMFKVAGREREGWLLDTNIKNFSCPDLKKIDQLWVKYSQGRFGFSVQKRIWLEVGGKTDWEAELKLGDRLGWQKNEKPLSNEQLTYSIQAEEGHLPWVYLDGFISFDLLKICEL